MKHRGFRAAFGADQNEQYSWEDSGGPLPTGSSGFTIVAEYVDIYGQGFVSKIKIVNEHDQEFSFVKKKR